MRVTSTDFVLSHPDEESQFVLTLPSPPLSVRLSGGMLSAADLTVPNGAGSSPVGE